MNRDYVLLTIFVVAAAAFMLWASGDAGAALDARRQLVQAFVDRHGDPFVIVRRQLLDQPVRRGADAGDDHGRLLESIARIGPVGSVELAFDPSLGVERAELAGWGPAFDALEAASSAEFVSRRALRASGFGRTLLRARLDDIVGTSMVVARLDLDEQDPGAAVRRWGHTLSVLLDAIWFGDMDLRRKATGLLAAALPWWTGERLARLPAVEQQALLEILERLQAGLPSAVHPYLEPLREGLRRSRHGVSELAEEVLLVAALEQLEVASGFEQRLAATLAIDELDGGAWQFVDRLAERRDSEAELLALRCGLAFLRGEALPEVPLQLRDVVVVEAAGGLLTVTISGVDGARERTYVRDE